MDISYIPMTKGFVYLAAVIDWYSRKLLAWRLSITTVVGFRIEAVQEVLHKYGAPEIFDQGRQLTSAALTAMLTGHRIRISTDGKGCWRDNVFVERL